MGFQIGGIVILVLLYSIYFGKMVLQKRRRIQTNQIAKGNKPKRLFWTEWIMRIATYFIVCAEIISIVQNSTWVPGYLRGLGFMITLIGVMVFAVSVYTMKDSWRAGIPGNDKTEFITTGIYRFSRNPAFLGFDLTYIGILVMFFNWLLLICTGFAMIMLHFQILQEEIFLEKSFGKEYMAYKGYVNRYFGKRG